MKYIIGKDRLFPRFTIIIIIVSLTYCSTSKEIPEKTEGSYLLHGGISYGGFVEDPDIDTISGATSLQFNLGVHSEIALKTNIRLKPV